MKELLKTLCALNGVSGDEDAVRDYLRTQAEPYADSIRTDALGNLIVFKRGRRATGSKLLLCAHMDEVGFMVREITDADREYWEGKAAEYHAWKDSIQ